VRVRDFSMTFKSQFARSVLTLIFTAALFAFLFERWLFMPTGWGLRKSIYFALIGAFIAGFFARLWIRKAILLAISGTAGLILGAAWAEYSISDVTISFVYALTYSLSLWWWIQFILLSSLIISWIIADYSVKKVKLAMK
jgi:hypothetical protein